jgi:hypothetical protein
LHQIETAFPIYGSSYSQVFFTKKGFSLEEHSPPAAMMLPPDTIYCSIIDINRGHHIREYPISRQVHPGDAERFQIVIGANKSAKLVLKLRFYVDKEHVIESKPFPIEIWNPRNAGFHNEYIDGDQARIGQKQNKKNVNMRETNDTDMEFHSRRDRRVPDEFPFHVPKDKSKW